MWGQAEIVTHVAATSWPECHLTEGIRMDRVYVTRGDRREDETWKWDGRCFTEIEPGEGRFLILF